MIVDQGEIDALLAQAGELVEETQAEVKEEVAAALAPPPSCLPGADDPEIARILAIRVPVIVQLAARRLTIGSVRKMSLGMIIEFDKSVEEPLELMINNRLVGRGEAVKVGEQFGIRITEIGDAEQRIKSLGA